MSLQTGVGGPVGKDMDERGRDTASRRAEACKSGRADASGGSGCAEDQLSAAEAKLRTLPGGWDERTGARQCGQAVESGDPGQATGTSSKAGAEPLRRRSW